MLKDTTTTAEQVVVSNTFETLMSQQRKGQMRHELSLKMQDLAKACASLLKPGKLVLTITCTPCAADGSAMKIEDEITLKLPQPRKSSSIFYALETGELVREDPQQQALDLKVVAKDQAMPAQANG